MSFTFYYTHDHTLSCIMKHVMLSVHAMNIHSQNTKVKFKLMSTSFYEVFLEFFFLKISCSQHKAHMTSYRRSNCTNMLSNFVTCQQLSSTRVVHTSCLQISLSKPIFKNHEALGKPILRLYGLPN